MCSCILFATQAAPEDWQIVPSTCVIHKSGDICRLEISVRRVGAGSTIPANTCITLADVLIRCSREEQLEIVLPVILPQTSILKITPPRGEAFTKTLYVQTIEPVKKRRRVRNPWSLF